MINQCRNEARSRARLWGVVLVVALVHAGTAHAQQSISSASVTGRVTDPSGAALAGARVVAHSLERNQPLQTVSLGRSRFDGLTLVLQSRRSRWGTLRASYTLSTSRDDAGNAFFSAPQDNVDVRADWGRSDNDQRHRVSLGGTTRPMAGIVLASVFSYGSAPPFNIQTGTDRNNDTNANDRPAGVGRNTGEGFDHATLDLRASRAFAVGHGHRVELLVDAFNLLNRTNFMVPNITFGPGLVPPSSFGRPTTAGDPRQVQLGLRWSF